MFNLRYLSERNNFNLKSISINFIYRFIPMVRSLKADGAIALMDVLEQVSLPLHSHFIKKSLKMSHVSMWKIAKPWMRKVRTSSRHLLVEIRAIHGTWYT